MRKRIKILFAKAILTAVLLLFIDRPGANAQVESTLDSVLASLHNSDLYVAPVIRGVSIIAKPVCTNDSQPVKHLSMFTVSSFYTSFPQWAATYDSMVLFQKLYILLEDPDRDLYADALLYELKDDRKLGKLLFLTREDWIKSGKRQCDLDFWREEFGRRGLLVPPVMENL